jgi:integrating conjugative element protein (TIGR03755 family)
VASLPALAIQRLTPALYDLLQNGILQASEEFHLGEISCEKIVEDMKKTNGGEGWDSIAVSRYWANASQAPDQDILLVKDEADEAGMNAGVPWLGGADRGGLNQEPIQTIRDTATAGYNLLLNRTPNAVGGNCADALICSTGLTATEAADWVVRVLGEKQIRTCMNCEKIASQAGMGLLRQYEVTLEEVVLGITELVNSNSAPNSEQLALVSAGNAVIVTRPVIEAIRAERARDALIQRLASEVALARTLEAALMARRALLAGRKEPNIASVEKAQSEIETTITELNGEIENVLFEMDVRQRMAGNTTLSVMLRNNQRGALPVGEDGQEQTMEDGGVSTE